MVLLPKGIADEGKWGTFVVDLSICFGRALSICLNFFCLLVSRLKYALKISLLDFRESDEFLETI